jgi:hypothetical protein
MLTIMPSHQQLIHAINDLPLPVLSELAHFIESLCFKFYFYKNAEVGAQTGYER